jgi:membrane-associated phospholipid phosphatase
VNAARKWLEETAWSLGPDLVLLGLFAVLLAVCMIAYGGSFSIVHSSTLLPLAGMLVLVGASSLAHRRVDWTTVRDWFPLVLILLVYGNFHDMTRLIHPDTVDAVLLRADERLFGFEPTVAMQAITVPWLTEYMTFAYALFFVFPTYLLMRTYARGDYLRFRELSLALSLCFYLGLLGYLTVPAIGPRYTVDYDVPLTGYLLTDVAARAWRMIESVQTDCFPSLHTAVSTIALVYFVRLRENRVFLAVVAFLVASLQMSTIYLRYHYGVDIIAGWLLAALCVSAAPAIVGAYYRMVPARA